ncbi:MAG: hypothetical protein U0744_03055 [Gemmataceae bacterium]
MNGLVLLLPYLEQKAAFKGGNINSSFAEVTNASWVSQSERNRDGLLVDQRQQHSFATSSFQSSPAHPRQGVSSQLQCDRKKTNYDFVVDRGND